MNVSAALATCDLNCNAITSIPSGHLQCISDVRFESKGDMCAAKGHVCFTLESGHVRCNGPCLLSAKCGHYDLSAWANGGPIERPARHACRSRREASQAIFSFASAISPSVT
jgi:hypothetical protein